MTVDVSIESVKLRRMYRNVCQDAVVVLQRSMYITKLSEPLTSTDLLVVIAEDQNFLAVKSVKNVEILVTTLS